MGEGRPAGTGDSSSRGGRSCPRWWACSAGTRRWSWRSASDDAIDDLERLGPEHGLDFDFRRSGWLWTATTTAQLGSWEPAVRLCEERGLEVFERLDPASVARRAGSEQHLAGVLMPGAAVVDPAALAVGLRTIALALGVEVFEGTRAGRIEPGAGGVRLAIPGGAVTAGKVVVATNAWAATLRSLRRALVVVSSDIVATPPVPDRLEDIGWTGREGITDSQAMIDYYRTTADGGSSSGRAAGDCRCWVGSAPASTVMFVERPPPSAIFATCIRA